MGSKQAYRRIWMRLFAKAAVQDGGEIAAVLLDTLRRYGEVEVSQSGPYWKIPDMLEFNVELTPHDRVDECLAALRSLTPRGWRDDVWNRVGADDPFLDPRVDWAWILCEEAATPPRFSAGEIVIVGDCQAAREQRLIGVRAVVGGFIASAPDDGCSRWAYSVMPEGWDEMIGFDELDLQPTGEHQPSDWAPPTWISVSTDGEITGHGD